MFGKKHTKKSKEKNRKSHLGKHHSEETKKKISKTWKGKHHSDDTKDKIRKANLGEKSHFWKGGISVINHSLRKQRLYCWWRKAILQRDNFTCQKCGQYGGKLIVHHINNFADFPELRLNIDNGIIFCEKCHNEFHKKYGRKNNTKEQLKEFLFK